MRTYIQTVRFEARFKIEAENAAEANIILEDLIRDAEWASEIEEQGHYEFEDEPIECPVCMGNCGMEDPSGEWIDCPKCEGSGSVPFEA